MRQRGTGRIYKQKGCSLWSIQYRKNGKRIREATHTDNRRVAEQMLKQRLAQIATGTFIGPKVERIRVCELAEPFFRDHEINGRKSKQPKMRWEKHLEPFFGARRVVDVGTDVLNEYVSLRLEQGAANATINREIAALRRMFRLGYYSHPQKVTRLPGFPHLKENNTRTGFIEPNQCTKLMANATELWMRGMIEVAYTYGWRIGEITGLRVRQANFAAGVIRLDPGTTKNDEGREVTMTAAVRSLLCTCAAGKDARDFIFTRADGTRIGDFRKRWRKLCVASGVPDLLVHDLRRTAARDMRRAGVPESVIMEIGGWKTRSVFERYNIVDQRDIREALGKLEQCRSEFEHNFGHNEPETKQRVN